MAKLMGKNSSTWIIYAAGRYDFLRRRNLEKWSQNCYTADLSKRSEHRLGGESIDKSTYVRFSVRGKRELNGYDVRDKRLGKLI